MCVHCNTPLLFLAKPKRFSSLVQLTLLLISLAAGKALTSATISVRLVVFAFCVVCDHFLSYVCVCV